MDSLKLAGSNAAENSRFCGAQALASGKNQRDFPQIRGLRVIEPNCQQQRRTVSTSKTAQ